VLDVTDEDGVINSARSVEADFGGVDVLVNNAGIGLLGPSMEFPLENWNATLSVMVTGVFLCSR
jgi:NAD(P)-dependent dehydrogenase (short-subunit alcohol dehydrogenase family)